MLNSNSLSFIHLSLLLMMTINDKRLLTNYERHETNMKKVWFIKNTDTIYTRNEITKHTCTFKCERNKYRYISYACQPVSLMKITAKWVIFNQRTNHDKWNICLNKPVRIGTINLEWTSAFFITLKCAHWMRYWSVEVRTVRRFLPKKSHSIYILLG